MRREIVIRIQVPASRRARVILLVLAITFGGGALVYSSVPNSFMAGDSLSSKRVNDNFAALDSRAAALENGRVASSNGAAVDSGPARLAWVRLIGDCDAPRSLISCERCMRCVLATTQGMETR